MESIVTAVIAVKLKYFIIAIETIMQISREKQIAKSYFCSPNTSNILPIGNTVQNATVLNINALA